MTLQELLQLIGNQTSQGLRPNGQPPSQWGQFPTNPFPQGNRPPGGMQGTGTSNMGIGSTAGGGFGVGGK